MVQWLRIRLMQGAGLHPWSGEIQDPTYCEASRESPNAATKPQHSQINHIFEKKEETTQVTVEGSGHDQEDKMGDAYANGTASTPHKGRMVINLTATAHQQGRQQALLKSEPSFATVQHSPNKILFLRDSYTEADGTMPRGNRARDKRGLTGSGGREVIGRSEPGLPGVTRPHGQAPMGGSSRGASGQACSCVRASAGDRAQAG